MSRMPADPAIPDATLEDAMDSEHAAEFLAWCDAMGVPHERGTITEFLAAVNAVDAELPIAATPPPFEVR